MHFVFIFLYLALHILIASSTNVTDISTSSIWTISSSVPLINHFLVYSSNLEKIIRFEPKLGWILNDEKKLHLYISGINLQNSSLVFSASINKCTPNDYISPIYSLSSSSSSSSIIELNVELSSISKLQSTVYICLLPASNISAFSSYNNIESFNGTLLEGPYFTFLREKSLLPFSAKICLILTLFLVSGFFR